MKKLILSFVFIALATWSSLATIRRVNPSPGIAGTNVYSTVAGAITAAVANDTIQLEPFAGGGSETTYNESVTVTKKLIFLGTGYFLDNPSLTSPPADKRWCTLNAIVFDNGSANSAVIGLSLNSLTINAPNIIISRSKVVNSIILGKSNNLVSGVYSYGNNIQITRTIASTIVGSNNNNTFIISGTYISNCIIFSQISSMINSVVRNNLFTYQQIVSNVGNSSFTNNIILASTNSTPILDANSTGNSLANNMVTNYSLLPANNNNINAVDPTTIFIVSSPYLGGNGSYVTENNLQLAAASPALGTGTGGIDMGIYGGNAPYVKSGLPPYPIITDASNSGLGNPSVSISGNVSVRSNN